jgi:hypothetical protein
MNLRHRQLLTILEKASGISRNSYPGTVAFPSGRVFLPGGGYYERGICCQLPECAGNKLILHRCSLRTELQPSGILNG